MTDLEVRGAGGRSESFDFSSSPDQRFSGVTRSKSDGGAGVSYSYPSDSRKFNLSRSFAETYSQYVGSAIESRGRLTNVYHIFNIVHQHITTLGALRRSGDSGVAMRAPVTTEYKMPLTDQQNPKPTDMALFRIDDEKVAERLIDLFWDDDRLDPQTLRTRDGRVFRMPCISARIVSEQGIDLEGYKI